MREAFASASANDTDTDTDAVHLDFAALSGVQRLVLPPLKREVELQVAKLLRSETF